MPKSKGKAPPDTVITLTLPASTSLQRSGTLVVRRGDLARIKTITFSETIGLARVIREALSEINALAQNPPVVPSASELREIQPAPAATENTPTGDEPAGDETDAETRDDDQDDAAEPNDFDSDTPDPLLNLLDGDIFPTAAEFLPLDVPADATQPQQLGLFAL